MIAFRNQLINGVNKCSKRSSLNLMVDYDLALFVCRFICKFVTLNLVLWNS